MNVTTLRTQESIVRVLAERYGRQTTLGELLAASIGIRRIAEGESLSVTRLAQYSGEATSSVSRWLSQVPHIELVADDRDQRRKSIRINDEAKAFSHLPALQQLIDQSITGEQGSGEQGSGESDSFQSGTIVSAQHHQR